MKNILGIPIKLRREELTASNIANLLPAKIYVTNNFTMTNGIFMALAIPCDSLPPVFPHPDGLELRILQRLFSEEQAALAGT